tara:strand:- start:227 stop:760 length:534 start_codon:yes stop_codon:yes gene_type:complete
MGITRIQEVKHYGGLEAEMPAKLQTGDRYFAYDTGKFYVANQDGVLVEPTGSGPLSVKVSLTANQIKNLGTTPIDAVVAPGVGKYIRVLNCDAWLTWGSVMFDDNPLTLKTEGAQDTQALDDYSLLARNYTHNAKLSTYETVDPYVENAKLQIVGTDSVASGDSTVDVYISYQIMDL